MTFSAQGEKGHSIEQESNNAGLINQEPTALISAGDPIGGLHMEPNFFCTSAKHLTNKQLIYKLLFLL